MPDDMQDLPCDRLRLVGDRWDFSAVLGAERLYWVDTAEGEFRRRDLDRNEM